MILKIKTHLKLIHLLKLSLKLLLRLRNLLKHLLRLKSNLLLKLQLSPRDRKCARTEKPKLQNIISYAKMENVLSTHGVAMEKKTAKTDLTRIFVHCPKKRDIVPFLNDHIPNTCNFQFNSMHLISGCGVIGSSIVGEHLGYFLIVQRKWLSFSTATTFIRIFRPDLSPPSLSVRFLDSKNRHPNEQSRESTTHE